MTDDTRRPEPPEGDRPAEPQAEAAPAPEATDAPADGAPPPETEAPAEEEPAQALAAALAERDELRDRLYRALAEMENLRKRAERDVQAARAYGGEKLARDVLSVHDNLRRALDTADDAAREAAGPLVEGVELTLKDLLSAFHRNAIETVSPEVGERFDPKLHEAMFEAPVPGAPGGSVIQVMETGFTISGRLLRPARVGVAAAAAPAGDASGEGG